MACAGVLRGCRCMRAAYAQADGFNKHHTSWPSWNVLQSGAAAAGTRTRQGASAATSTTRDLAQQPTQAQPEEPARSLDEQRTQPEKEDDTLERRRPQPALQLRSNRQRNQARSLKLAAPPQSLSCCPCSCRLCCVGFGALGKEQQTEMASLFQALALPRYVAKPT